MNDNGFIKTSHELKHTKVNVIKIGKTGQLHGQNQIFVTPGYILVSSQK